MSDSLNTMNAKHQRESQSGNALIYVLVAIALFAALSFTLSRQTDTGEAGALSNDKAELYATQLINYAAQAKSAVDQMMFTGTTINQLDFTLPTGAGFNAGSPIHKVYHPAGGGLLPGRIPDEVQTSEVADPVSGWYLGRFNNVEWTASASDDVILVAYQINKAVCEKINEKVAGISGIPVLGDSIKEVMIDDSLYAGTNVDFTTDPTGTPICATCHKQSSLCVQNQGLNAYGFYTIIADQ